MFSTTASMRSRAGRRAAGAWATESSRGNGMVKPVYYVAEQDISNPEGYANEFVPRAAALIKAAGGRYVAAGGVGSAGKVTGFDGDPPKSRVVIHVWDSLEQIQAWYNSPEYKEARKIGEKYAKFRSFAVDGVPQ